MLKAARLACYIFLLLSVQAMAAETFQLPEPLKYGKFLELRGQDNVVILNAAKLEKYFMVVPESQKASGITQAQLDDLLASVIPSKETKVILYCHQTFEPTRSMPASTSVAFSLMQNGYKNVETMAPLWTGSADAEKAQILGKTEVIPYAKQIPENYPLENKSE